MSIGSVEVDSNDDLQSTPNLLEPKVVRVTDKYIHRHIILTHILLFLYICSSDGQVMVTNLLESTILAIFRTASSLCRSTIGRDKVIDTFE